MARLQGVPWLSELDFIGLDCYWPIYTNLTGLAHFWDVAAVEDIVRVCDGCAFWRCNVFVAGTHRPYQTHAQHAHAAKASGMAQTHRPYQTHAQHAHAAKASGMAQAAPTFAGGLGHQ